MDCGSKGERGKERGVALFYVDVYLGTGERTMMPSICFWVST